MARWRRTHHALYVDASMRDGRQAPPQQFIERLYGDGGYQGPKAARAAAKTGTWIIEIVGRSPAAIGFEVLPKRWIVERTVAWLSRFRRLARDFERYARTVAAFIRLAMTRIVLKRLVASPSS